MTDIVRLPLAKPRSRADEKAEKKQKADKHKRDVYRLVDHRDGQRCRAYKTRVNPFATSLLERAHRHHITFRSRGGNDTTDNIVTLCAQAHADVHAGRLHISGNADETLRFEKDGRQWKG